MCRRSFCVAEVQELKKLCRELVDKFLAAVHVNLGRNSKLQKPISVDGIGHRFTILAGNCSDHSVLSKCIRNAQDKFLVTVRCDHWPKKICMNLEVWTFRNGKWCQRSPFVGGLFPLLAAKAEILVPLNLLDHLRPVVLGGNLQVGFVSSTVASISSTMGFAHCFLPVS
jgi:hypothetical protein